MKNLGSAPMRHSAGPNFTIEYFGEFETEIRGEMRVLM
jgi:hypothetical protein